MFAYGRDHQAAPLRSYEECMSSIRAGTFRPDQSRSGMVIVADSAIFLNPSDSSFEALNSAPAPRAQATECLDEHGHQEDGAAGESAANSSECAARGCGALSSLKDKSSSGSDSSGERSGDEVVYEDLGPRDSLSRWCQGHLQTPLMSRCGRTPKQNPCTHVLRERLFLHAAGASRV